MQKRSNKTELGPSMCEPSRPLHFPRKWLKMGCTPHTICLVSAQSSSVKNVELLNPTQAALPWHAPADDGPRLALRA